MSAVDYLLKPFDDARFQATVARVRRRAGRGSRLRPPGGARRRCSSSWKAVRGCAPRRSRACWPKPAAACTCSMWRRSRWWKRTATTCASPSAAKLSMRAARWRRRRDPSSSQPMLRISRSCLVNMNHVREVSRTPRGDFILVRRRHDRHQQRGLPRAGAAVLRAPEARPGLSRQGKARWQNPRDTQRHARPRAAPPTGRSACSPPSICSITSIATSSRARHGPQARRWRSPTPSSAG